MAMNVRETKLENGVRVVSSTIPSVESASIGVWVGVGGRHETDKFAGASHLIEHMLFKGTKRRSARQISHAIEGRGGYVNAFTQEEDTCYYAHVPAEHLNLTLDVLTDMYLNPRFDAADLAKEKGVVIEEIMMCRDQPQQMVQEILGQALWKGHPLGRPISGSPETVQSMTRDEMISFKRGNYVPGNTIFAFAGRLEHEASVKEVAKRVSGMLPAVLPRYDAVSADVGQDAIVLQAKDIEQAHLAIGVRIPFGACDSRRYILRVLNTVLGENMSSRLFRVVREKHGLAYYVNSSFQLLHDTGAVVVSAGLDRRRHRKAVDLIVNELVRLKERPVPAAELTRARDYIIGQIKLGLESTRQQMLWIGDNIMAHGEFIPPEDVIRAISAVTAEDIQKLASSMLRRPCATIAMVGRNLSASDEKAFMEIAGNL